MRGASTHHPGRLGHIDRGDSLKDPARQALHGSLYPQTEAADEDWDLRDARDGKDDAG